MASWQLVILSVVVVVIAISGMTIWTRHRRTVAGCTVAGVLAVHGPTRCRAAAVLLARLSVRGSPESIRTAFDAIELPVLQALPDCPPQTKQVLCDALDACASRVANRELAKRLVAMRNGLVA